MGAAFDDQLRSQLLRLFADPATGVVEFKWTAMHGGARADEGYKNLLPPKFTDQQQRAALKSALARHLAQGGHVSVEESSGDAEMGIDAARYFQFRVHCLGVRLFVKVWLDEEDDPDDPTLYIISVKRDDHAWT